MEQNGYPSDFEQEEPIVIYPSKVKLIDDFYRDKGGKSLFLPAVGLYVFMYYTSRRQGNNRVWMNTSFIMKYRRVTKKTLTQLFSDLEEMGLIKIHQTFKKNGSFGKKYIEVKFIWKPEVLQKLFYQEQNETTEYKIARALLLENFGEFYNFDNDSDIEFEIDIGDRRETIIPEYFYFEDGMLWYLGLIGGDGEISGIVPSYMVKEIIRDIAGMFSYKTDAIYRALVYKIDE